MSAEEYVGTDLFRDAVVLKIVDGNCSVENDCAPESERGGVGTDQVDELREGIVSKKLCG